MYALINFNLKDRLKEHVLRNGIYVVTHKKYFSEEKTYKSIMEVDGDKILIGGLTLDELDSEHNKISEFNAYPYIIFDNNVYKFIDNLYINKSESSIIGSFNLDVDKIHSENLRSVIIGNLLKNNNVYVVRYKKRHNFIKSSEYYYSIVHFNINEPIINAAINYGAITSYYVDMTFINIKSLSD